MSLKLFVNGVAVPLTVASFPAGETRLQIDPEDSWAHLNSGHASVVVRLAYENDQDLMNLMFLVDAVRRRWPRESTEIHLTMLYMPYARQDRVCNKGESLSIAVIARLINSLHFSKVTCINPHSEVTPALFDRLEVIDLNAAAWRLVGLLVRKDTYLVSPDAGANKKVFDYAKHFGFMNVIRADKTRDVATGAITGTKVFSEGPVPAGVNFLILDDICDGGRTFIELSIALRAQYPDHGKIMLYVSHAIMSKGIAVVADHFDVIYTSNKMTTEQHEKLIEI